MPVTLATVRNFALALPDVAERPCHATPAFYVGGKLIARLREDGETLAVACPRNERDAMLEKFPDVFSVTPHFQNYDYILLSLLAVNENTLREMLENAWCLRAGKKRLAARARRQPR